MHCNWAADPLNGRTFSRHRADRPVNSQSKITEPQFRLQLASLSTRSHTRLFPIPASARHAWSGDKKGCGAPGEWQDVAREAARPIAIASSTNTRPGGCMRMLLKTCIPAAVMHAWKAAARGTVFCRCVRAVSGCERVALSDGRHRRAHRPRASLHQQPPPG